MLEKYRIIWDKLSTFVYNICSGVEQNYKVYRLGSVEDGLKIAKYGQFRDESHGHEHMKTVAKLSIEIFKRECIQNPQIEKLAKLVIIVSWLHDVIDHKYDTDRYLRHIVCGFLKYDLKEEDNVICLVWLWLHAGIPP